MKINFTFKEGRYMKYLFAFLILSSSSIYLDGPTAPPNPKPPKGPNGPLPPKIGR